MKNLAKRNACVLFCTFLLNCSAAPDQGTTPQPEPQVPLGRQLSLLDFLPAEASGAALIEVERLRPTSRGPQLISLVRRVGIGEWEDVTGMSLDAEVGRLLVYVVPTAGSEPGDLSTLLDATLEASLGIVVEQSSDMAAPPCHEGPLSQMEPELLAGVGDQMWSTTCGPFRILQRYDMVVGVGPHPDSPVAQALRALTEGGEGRGLVLSAVVGPNLVDRAECGEGITAALAGWQEASVEVGENIALRGRYHATSPDAVDDLQTCVADGLGGLGGVPLFSDLELGGILDEGMVHRDPQAPADVTLAVTFTEDQFDLMMGLLELVGEGIQ